MPTANKGVVIAIHERAADIAMDRRDGLSFDQIAAKYGMHKTTVYRIHNGLSRRADLLVREAKSLQEKASRLAGEAERRLSIAERILKCMVDISCPQPSSTSSVGSSPEG